LYRAFVSPFASLVHRRLERHRSASMKTLFARFVRESDGQDLIEYALLAGTIALGVTAAMMLIRDNLNSKFSEIGNSISAGS
jgi:Flp pilus assembly pilin Flp